MLHWFVKHAYLIRKVNAKDAKDWKDLETNKFKPQTTEFLFGQEDQIIGYKNPKINVYFAPSSLFSLVKTGWDGTLLEALNAGPKRKADDGAIPMTDITGIVNRFMSSIPEVEEEDRNVRTKLDNGSVKSTEKETLKETNPVKPYKQQALYTTDVQEFIEQTKHEGEFDPLDLGGVPVQEYESQGNTYQILKFHPVPADSQDCNDKQKALQAFFRRISVLTPFVIEDAQQIERTDDRWWLFVTFLKQGWKVVGFTTVYTFYCHPHALRARISQFGVLPHCQKQGHGRKLYDAVMDVLRSDTLFQGISQGANANVWNEFWEMPVKDIGVELPSDTFIDIRDRSDASYILGWTGEKKETLEALNGIPADQVVEKVAEYAKLTPVQARRMCETITLGNLLHRLSPNAEEALQALTNPRKKHSFDPETVKQVRKLWMDWKMWVKVRVWKKNKDVVADMMSFERKQKLDEVVIGLQKDYIDILVKL